MTARDTLVGLLGEAKADEVIEQAAREPTPRRRGVYPISICGCWWIVDRLSPCPSHTNPEETL